jgi:hypothetical protein
MRKRLVELIRGRDDVVWASLQALGEDAIGAARQLERRLHHGHEDAGARRELQLAALRADENLRHLNRLHNAFAAPQADRRSRSLMASQLRDLDIDLITRGHLAKGLESLREQFAGTFSPETIERYLVESVEGLSDARFKDFVPCSCASTTPAAARWISQRSSRSR